MQLNHGHIHAAADSLNTSSVSTHMQQQQQQQQAFTYGGISSAPLATAAAAHHSSAAPISAPPVLGAVYHASSIGLSANSGTAAVPPPFAAATGWPSHSFDHALYTQLIAPSTSLQQQYQQLLPLRNLRDAAGEETSREGNAGGVGIHRDATAAFTGPPATVGSGAAAAVPTYTLTGGTLATAALTNMTNVAHPSTPSAIAMGSAALPVSTATPAVPPAVPPPSYSAVVATGGGGGATEGETKETQRQRILHHVNELLQFCNIQQSQGVTSIRQCSSSFFVLLYQRLFDCTIDHIDRSPNTLEKKRRNVSLVLEELRKRHYDLRDISAEEVVGLNEEHISRLILVFVQIAERMKEEQQAGAAAAASGGGAVGAGLPAAAGGGYTVAEVPAHPTHAPPPPPATSLPPGVLAGAQQNIAMTYAAGLYNDLLASHGYGGGSGSGTAAAGGGQNVTGETGLITAQQLAQWYQQHQLAAAAATAAGVHYDEHGMPVRVDNEFGAAAGLAAEDDDLLDDELTSGYEDTSTTALEEGDEEHGGRRRRGGVGGEAAARGGKKGMRSGGGAPHHGGGVGLGDDGMFYEEEEEEDEDEDDMGLLEEEDEDGAGEDNFMDHPPIPTEVLVKTWYRGVVSPEASGAADSPNVTMNKSQHPPTHSGGSYQPNESLPLGGATGATTMTGVPPSSSLLRQRSPGRRGSGPQPPAPSAAPQIQHQLPSNTHGAVPSSHLAQPQPQPQTTVNTPHGVTGATSAPQLLHLNTSYDASDILRRERALRGMVAARGTGERYRARPAPHAATAAGAGGGGEGEKLQRPGSRSSAQRTPGSSQPARAPSRPSDSLRSGFGGDDEGDHSSRAFRAAVASAIPHTSAAAAGTAATAGASGGAAQRERLLTRGRHGPPPRSVAIPAEVGDKLTPRSPTHASASVPGPAAGSPTTGKGKSITTTTIRSTAKPSPAVGRRQRQQRTQSPHYAPLDGHHQQEQPATAAAVVGEGGAEVARRTVLHRPPSVLLDEPPLTRAECRLLASHPNRLIDSTERDRKIERLRTARFLRSTQDLLRRRMRHQYDESLSEMRSSLKQSMTESKHGKLVRMRWMREESEKYRAAYETLMESAANDVRVPREMMSRYTTQLAEYYAASLEESRRMCEYLAREQKQRDQSDLVRYAETVSAWQQKIPI